MSNPQAGPYYYYLLLTFVQRKEPTHQAMVEFGKTLTEVVNRDWRCHAVAYIELKRCLSGENDDDKQQNTASADDHSDHTESSFKVTEEQKDEFFRIYDDSIRRLVHFYEDRLEWSVEEKNSLEVACS